MWPFGTFWGSSKVVIIMYFVQTVVQKMFYKSKQEKIQYNNFQMKNFNLFLLTVGILVWSSYSTIGFAVVGPFTTGAFNCLYSSEPNSNQYAIIRAYQNSHSPAGIDPYAIQTIQNAWAAYYGTDIYVQICREINATSQINEVINGIINPLSGNPSAFFVKEFYIKVEPSSNPDCSWEGYSHSDNCNFLTEAANAINNIGDFWSPGVFTTANIWNSFFGSTCSTFAGDTGAQLWYADYDSTGNVNSVQSFDDYVSFGGWSYAAQNLGMKQVGKSTTVPLLCGHTAWHALIDILYLSAY